MEGDECDEEVDEQGESVETGEKASGDIAVRFDLIGLKDDGNGLREGFDIMEDGESCGIG